MPLLLPLLPTLTLLATLSVATALHSNDEFVRNLYRAILCREGDEPGIQEKVASLASGKLTRAQMIMLARWTRAGQGMRAKTRVPIAYATKATSTLSSVLLAALRAQARSLAAAR